jgi:hypothetical protein
MAGHLAYELLAGVAVPLAPRLGIRAAAAGYAMASVTAYRAAGRWSGPGGDRAFAAVNGLFLSAVVTHYTTWPTTRRRRIPWLVECEGLDGAAVGPYNLVLQVSAVAAVGGLVENRRGWPAALVAVGVGLPVLRWSTPREYRRLLDQAAATPRWWNRRLVARHPAGRPASAAHGQRRARRMPACQTGTAPRTRAGGRHDRRRRRHVGTDFDA